MTRQVGLIGLGYMGKAIAHRILAAGEKLYVFNRTPGKAESLMQQGAILVDSPKSLAKKCDVIITMVSDNDALRKVAFDEDGFIHSVTSGDIVVDMSTVTEHVILEIAGKVHSAGGNVLHAPVLGGPMDVFTGSATICVGGPKSTYQAAHSILQKISDNVYIVGELEHASRMKFALNIMLTHYLFGVASSLAFARKGDLPEELVLDIITRIAGNIVERIGKKMLNQERGVSFSIKNYEKDQRYFLDIAEQLGVDLPTIESVQKYTKNLIENGKAEEDMTIIFDHLGKSNNWRP